MANIKVKNKKTKVEREFTEDEWKAVKANKLLDGVFVQIKSAKTPPEVKEVEDRKAKAEASSKPATNGSIASPLKAEK